MGLPCIVFKKSENLCFPTFKKCSSWGYDSIMLWHNKDSPEDSQRWQKKINASHWQTWPCLPSYDMTLKQCVENFGLYFPTQKGRKAVPSKKHSVLVLWHGSLKDLKQRSFCNMIRAFPPKSNLVWWWDASNNIELYSSTDSFIAKIMHFSVILMKRVESVGWPNELSK